METWQAVPRRLAKRDRLGESVRTTDEREKNTVHGHSKRDDSADTGLRKQLDRYDDEQRQDTGFGKDMAPLAPSTPARRGKVTLRERQKELKEVLELGNAPPSPPPTRHKGKHNNVDRPRESAHPSNEKQDILKEITADIDMLPESARALWTLYRAVEQAILLLIGAGELVQIMDEDHAIASCDGSTTSAVAVSYLSLRPAVERAASRAFSEEHLAQMGWIWQKAARESQTPVFQIHSIRTLDRSTGGGRGKRKHTFALAISEPTPIESHSSVCICVACGDKHSSPSKRSRTRTSEGVHYGIGNIVGRWSAAIETRQTSFGKVLLEWYAQHDRHETIPSIILPRAREEEDIGAPKDLLEHLASPDRSTTTLPPGLQTPTSNHKRKSSIAMMLASPPASPSANRDRRRTLTAEMILKGRSSGSAGQASCRLSTDDLLASPAGRKALGVKVLTSTPPHLPLAAKSDPKPDQVKTRASSLLERIRAKESQKLARQDQDHLDIEAGGLGSVGRRKRSVELGRLLEGGCLDAIYLNFLQDLVQKSGDLTDHSKTSAKSVRDLAQSVIASAKIPLSFREAVDLIHLVNTLCPAWLSLGLLGGTEWAVLSTGRTSSAGQAAFAESLRQTRLTLEREAMKLHAELS